MNKCLKVSAIGLAAMSLSCAVHADISTNIFIKWNAQDGSEAVTTNQMQTLTTGVSQLSKDNYWQFPERATGGSALAQAEYGVLKSYSFASAFENNESGIVSQGYASSLANWSDVVVFTSPGVSATTSGTANALIYIDGAGLDYDGMTFGPTGVFQLDAQATLTVSAASSDVFRLDMRKYCSAATACPELNYIKVNGVEEPDFRGFFEVSIPISFSPFGNALSATLSTHASRTATNSALGSSSADLARSVYWAGISSIDLPDGRVITDFEALGNISAHNYALSSVPVPEPNTVSLYFFGIGALALKFCSLRRRSAREVT